LNIILDTHVFLWALSKPENLRQKYLEYIESPSNTIFVSSVCVAEISIKVSIGKLVFDYKIDDVINESGFETLSFTVEDALFLKNLPFHHKDPFDRMLIAESLSTGYNIISDDEFFKMYNCNLL
jgi:PIN domain nuclease of toxin-antitoxin system